MARRGVDSGPAYSLGVRTDAAKSDSMPGPGPGHYEAAGQNEGQGLAYSFVRVRSCMCVNDERLFQGRNHQPGCNQLVKRALSCMHVDDQIRLYPQ